MPIIARIRKAPTIKAKVNQLNGVLTTQPASFTLGKVLTSATRIDELLDVIEAAPQSGDTLVYNSTNDKYEVKPISVTSNNIIDVDGGTF